ENLAAERGGRPVFSGVLLSVGAGQLMALVGPNGAGKSSLLRAIAGLLRPAGGSVRFEPEAERSEFVHYLGHLDGLKGAETASGNLAFWRRLAAHPGDDPVEALEAVGLGHLDAMPAGYLSAG